MFFFSCVCVSILNFSSELRISLRSLMPLKVLQSKELQKNSKAVLFCCEIYFNADKGSTRATSEINVGQCDRCRRQRTNEAAIPVFATRDVFWPSAMEVLLEGKEPNECTLTFWRRIFFFQILAHPVFKM